jgi:hypothetical protein
MASLGLENKRGDPTKYGIHENTVHNQYWYGTGIYHSTVCSNLEN